VTTIIHVQSIHSPRKVRLFRLNNNSKCGKPQASENMAVVIINSTLIK